MRHWFSQDKNIRIYNGDCLDVMQNLSEVAVTVDMILTDPPYAKTRNKWDSIIPFTALWEHTNKLIKVNGATVLFGQGSFSAKLCLSNEKDHRYNMVWDKRLPSGFLNSNRMPLPVHEDVLVFYKKMVKYNPQKFKGKKNNGKGSLDKDYENNNYGDFEMMDNRDILGDMKFPRSIISYETVLSYQKPHPSVCVHPTQKPVELLEYLIKTYTNEGDLVLDFTAGSFSTAIACIRTNRRFIGIELDEKYYNIGLNRIQEELNESSREEPATEGIL